MFVLSLILGTQVIALFVQYKVNKAYKGIGDWLIGSSLMALGFILMPLVSIKGLEKIARIANPLLIIGHIFFYIGIKKFLNRKVNKWIPISIFILFNMFYYYNMYIDNNVSIRTLAISTAIATISLLIAYELFFKSDKVLSSSSKFTSAVFFIYGVFYIGRIFLTVILDPANSYIDLSLSITATVIISIIISNLWTLGLIIMINQMLNIENHLEKNKLQLIFDTNIDAQLITKLDDGFIVEANEEFYKLSGYSKDEVIGQYAKNSSFWNNPEDRKTFIAEINAKDSCENM
nr:PAS domain S-box protein [Tissierella sp.]